MIKINCIATPRNISTALMYSFAQRADTTVVDEPFYASYLSKTGIDHPGRHEILQSQAHDVDEVLGELNSIVSPVVFVKNMAHHVRIVELRKLEDWKHLFLIRDPSLLITSFAKVIPNPTMDDIGSADQATQFKSLLASGHTPVVLDSGELIKDPEGVMTRICDQLGIRFEKTMLKWDRGQRPEDGVWAKYWYASVHNTTGFERRVTSSVQVPEHCQALLEKALPNYEMLYSHAIKA